MVVSQVSPCLGSFEAWGWWEATRLQSTQRQTGDSSPLTKADFSILLARTHVSMYRCTPSLLTANTAGYANGAKSNAAGGERHPRGRRGGNSCADDSPTEIQLAASNGKLGREMFNSRQPPAQSQRR